MIERKKDEPMFYETALQYQLPFTPFSLYPPAANRKAWSGLDEQWKTETLRLGEQYLNYVWPSINATDFMDFSRTGNRVRYEDKFFARRHALDALVLAECVEHKGRFVDDIINGIFLISEESAWQLPPHNTYIRDTPQFLLPDKSAPVLDLFACETGAVLATASYLLSDQLDQVSPFINKRILHEVQERIITPYLECYFWWMGNGEEPLNNWTVWCTQNVLFSVFLLNIDSSVRLSVIHKACKSIDYFLAEYGDDGCCDEGAQYYRHAGLCLFNAMELLCAVTGDAFAGFYQDQKIRNIASYLWNVHIHDIYYVNFADCSPVAGRAGSREFLFARKTGNADMASFAASDFLAGIPDTLLSAAENNLYYRLQNAFTIRQMRDFAACMPASLKHPDLYYPSVGIFIARDDSLCLAVKAGDNDDSHNHNDTGSFTIYKNGRPMFIDIGVESYTKKTFSADRYEIWTMQSAYHNLPTINGIMQKDGAQYHACDITHRLTDSVCGISMDISAAYPPECGLAFYRRTASLIKGSEIIIRDCFAFKDGVSSPKEPLPGKDCLQSRPPKNTTLQAPVVLSFMTSEKPVPAEGPGTEEGSLVLSIGSLGTLRLSGGSLLRTETIPINDTRLKTAWPHEIYRTLVNADSAGTDTETEIEMHIS